MGLKVLGSFAKTSMQVEYPQPREFKKIHDLALQGKELNKKVYLIMWHTITHSVIPSPLHKLK